MQAKITSTYNATLNMIMSPLTMMAHVHGERSLDMYKGQVEHEPEQVKFKVQVNEKKFE